MWDKQLWEGNEQGGVVCITDSAAANSLSSGDNLIVGYPEIPSMLKIAECDLEEDTEVQISYDEAQHVQPMDLDGTWECLCFWK